MAAPAAAHAAPSHRASPTAALRSSHGLSRSIARHADPRGLAAVKGVQSSATTATPVSGSVFFGNALTQDADVFVTVNGQTVPLFPAFAAGTFILQPILLPAGTYQVTYNAVNSSTVLSQGPLVVTAGKNESFMAAAGDATPLTFTNDSQGVPLSVTAFSFRNATANPLDAYLDSTKVATGLVQGSSVTITAPVGMHNLALAPTGQPLSSASPDAVISDPIALPGAFVDDVAVTSTSSMVTGGYFTSPSAALTNGYTLAASDGGIFNFGTQGFYGSTGGMKLNQPIVGAASAGLGYYEVARDGGVFTFGPTALFAGSLGGKKLAAPIVGMAVDQVTGGYWLVAADGGVFAFKATFAGSLGGKKLNAPIVGIAADPSSEGYFLVGADGGLFAFGGATTYGSLGGTKLNAPVVGIAATPDGGGYWMTASDGGIFTFGDADYLGSTGGTRLNNPVVGIVAGSDGLGYSLVASDGGAFTFGTASFYGSTGGTKLNRPVVTGF